MRNAEKESVHEFRKSLSVQAIERIRFLNSWTDPLGEALGDAA
jgi:hypothetical protein